MAIEIQRAPATLSDVALRASSYVIYVDLPTTRNEMLLVHGYTGAYDKVSRSVAAYVRALEKQHVSKPLYGNWTAEEIDFTTAARPSDEVIAVLKKRGYLTTKSIDEEEQYFVRHVKHIQPLLAKQMPDYVIMTTYDCNLRCGYCFQDHMRKDPQLSHLLRVMGREIADRIINAIPSIEARHIVAETANLPRNITFFGGEPLLPQSRGIVEYLMRRFAEKGPARFLAVTNGTHLEQYRDLLGPDKISQLQITLDGPPDEHDKRRIRADGSGTFETIASNISMALSLETDVSVRLNIDRDNVGMLPHLAKIFVQRGWAADRHFSAYAAPIHGGGGDTERRRLFNSWELNQALEDLRAQCGEMSVISSSDGRLLRAARAVFSGQNTGFPVHTSFCGAHANMYVLDPFGDIYACWERTGDQRVRIGRITEDSKVELTLLHDQWRGRHVVSNEVCRRCRFSLHCGGGCAVLAEAVSGTMFANHCDAFGKRFRSAVAQAYLEHVQGGADEESLKRDAAAAEMEAFVR